jgi:arginase family enzyme
VGRHPGLLGLEIAEFNPDKDVNNRTAELVIDLLAATVGLRG